MTFYKAFEGRFATKQVHPNYRAQPHVNHVMIKINRKHY